MKHYNLSIFTEGEISENTRELEKFFQNMKPAKNDSKVAKKIFSHQ